MKGSLEEPEWSKYSSLCAQLVLCDPLGITSSVDLQRDSDLIENRCRLEGVSFLTKTLPKLGKELDAGLETGRLKVPQGFHLDRTRNRPAFMQAYFSLLFDEDGSILEEAPAGAVKHIRQVCFFAYKLDVPYSDDLNLSVIDKFISTEQEISSLVIEDDDPLLELSARITESVFKGFDPMDILPRHGPGAVATGEKLDEKWEFSRKFTNIHRVYPYYEYFVVGRGREILDRLGWYTSLSVHESGSAKVVLVPKDSRGPRLISCEPLEYQWIQQGLGRKLAEHFESNRFTRGSINFRDQGVNQRLALASSTSREYSTIDLQDASDRVTLKLVERVFRYTPQLLKCLVACRTTATVLPDGSTLELKKFAPMGSALCFPVESYLFWVILVAASVRRTRLPLQRVGHSIFVYGDDIVVPADWTECCMDDLERYGLRVNRSKSFTNGFFRESCGVDAYKGVMVTPSRLRVRWTGRKTDGAAFASYVALMNELHSKGYYFASDYLLGLIQRTYGKLPFGTFRSEYPCRIVSSPLEAELWNSQSFKRRWNPQFQRFEFKVLKLSVRKIKTQLDSWPRLLRDNVTPQVGDPSVVVLPRSTLIKRGWAAVS